MSRRKLLIGTAGPIALLAIASTAAFFVLTKASFPKTRGEIELPGIEASVRIVRDRSGVPHIYAETARDMYFAQGYAHAQDRFWQMEFWRRLGAGRLSELFGEATLGVDRFIRTMGFREIAEREYAQLNRETRTAIDAYADGINAYLEKREPRRIALQFRLLEFQGVDVEIEPWKPFHSLTWLKIMAYNLGSNMQDELDLIALARRIGFEQAMQFFPDYRFDTMPTIASRSELEQSLGPLEELGSDASGTPPELSRRLLDLVPESGELPNLSAVNALLGREARGSIGSNAWAVSGDQTASGAPLLAADLHLGVQMPSIWYEAHLHAETDIGSGSSRFDAAGFTFPGVPGVIVGHNGTIAWGMTNVNPDVQDLYIERIHPDDPYRYRYGDEWREMTTRFEQISIEGRSEPESLIVRETHHGPIVSNGGAEGADGGFMVTPPAVPERGAELTELSLRWTALEPNRTYRSIHDLNRARNFEEFREAARNFDIPSQNLVYADSEGTIGYQMPGKIPIRSRGTGRLPVPGWTEQYEWKGFIPFEELPYIENPEKGYIATANNAVAPPDYPYHITAQWDHGYRARRIVDMIVAASSGDAGNDGEPRAADIDRETFAGMQADTRNLSASELIPALSSLHLEAAEIGGRVISAERMDRLRTLMQDWNRDMSRESRGAAAFAFFFQALVEETFRDELGEELWQRDRLLGSISRIQSLLARLVHRPENPWWDDIHTPEIREGRDEILTRALGRAIAIGETEAGSNMEGWRLGDVHTLTFKSQTFGESEIGLVRALVNRGPIEAPAGLQQVYSADWNLADPFETLHYSSMRQIIDLADLDRSLLIHPVGQSGHPYNPHYADFMTRWRDTEYHEHLWSRERLNASETNTLTLVPAP